MRIQKYDYVNNCTNVSFQGKRKKSGGSGGSKGPKPKDFKEKLSALQRMRETIEKMPPEERVALGTVGFIALCVIALEAALTIAAGD